MVELAQGEESVFFKRLTTSSAFFYDTKNEWIGFGLSSQCPVQADRLDPQRVRPCIISEQSDSPTYLALNSIFSIRPDPRLLCLQGTRKEIQNGNSLEVSMTFVGLLPVSLARLFVFSFCVWGLVGLWVGLDLGVLDVIGLGLSSSGLSEDSEDPVEEPRSWRDRDRSEVTRLRSPSRSLSMSRARPDTLLLEAWTLN